MDWIDKLYETCEPMSLFADWFTEAKTKEISDPEAMVLSTIDSHGMPNARVVLMRHFDQNGFIFYSNNKSTKGQELAKTKESCLLFYWKSLGRQIRIRGTIETFSHERADAYFASRPHGSKLGAWASKQSQPLSSRYELMEAVTKLESDYPEGTPVPRPDYWVGFQLSALEMEFWQAGDFRLHDRVRLTRQRAEGRWTAQRLFP